jgi:hypothetical protein
MSSLQVANKTSSYILHTASSLQVANTQNVSQLFKFSADYKIDDCEKSTNSSCPLIGVDNLRVVQIECIPNYKYPNIDSGATPIGSTGRAPDRKTILRKNSTKEMKRKKI